MARSLLALVFATWALAAKADNLDLVSFGNVNWNPNTNPNFSENIQIQNTANTGDLVFNGYALGLSFGTVSGAGKLAVASYSNPATNPAVPNFDSPIPPAGTEPDDGAGVRAYISNSNSTTASYSIPTTPVNLLTMEFEAGSVMPTVGSVFDIWANGTMAADGDTQYFNSARPVFLREYRKFNRQRRPRYRPAWHGHDCP